MTSYFPFNFCGGMEYLSRLLMKISKKQEFEFHYRCAPMQITHLVFKDDLMMFCKGNASSVMMRVTTMKAFRDVSGLSATMRRLWFILVRCIMSFRTELCKS